MIIATSKSDTMLKKAVGKGQTSIISIQKMLDQFALDPTITEPKRDAYIVTNEDISAARLRQYFEQALLTKHPNTRVIFINKTSKPMYPNGLPGCNVILQKPKPQDIAQSISSVIDMALTREAATQYQGGPGVYDAADNIPTQNPTENESGTNNKTGSTIPEYAPKMTNDFNEHNETAATLSPEAQALQVEQKRVQLTTPTGDVIEAIQTTTANGEVNYTDLLGTPIDATGMPISELPIGNNAPAPELRMDVEPVIRDSELVKRIKRTDTVSDISVVTREMTSAALIKDLINSNSTYAGIEDKLQVIKDAIFEIFRDNRIPTLEVKLSRVHAMLHDKAFYSEKGDTLIEQRFVEIIDAICIKTVELFEKRTNEIDTAIRQSYLQKDFENMDPRLASLTEDTKYTGIEIMNLITDIQEIHKSIDSFAFDVAGSVKEEVDSITGNVHLDAHIKARQTNVISQKTINVIKSIIRITTEKASDQFNELQLKGYALLDLYHEYLKKLDKEAEARDEYFMYLKEKRVEDTVEANTLLKKSLRVFIGCEDSGRTIIPYLMSRYKSNQNANVLLLDLTGTGKYDNYGIQYQNLDTYLAELNQRPFHAVAGKLENSIQAAQRIVTALLKAADYYRVINVVLTPEQRELLETIAQDTLIINYLVNTNVRNIDKMKEVIERSQFENVARCIIVNSCDIPIHSIAKRIGVYDRLDYRICSIPTISELADASLNCYNPYGISSVEFAMEEVLKHA